MREVHVVALSPDGSALVLTGTKGSRRGSYRLAIPPRVREAFERELAAAEGGAGPVESALPPREIQARLRGGESVERVAKAAGVPLDRVRRYYGPVLAERIQIVEQARTAYLSRSRRGESALPVGEAVDANLSGRGVVRPEAQAWDAHRGADGRWVVTLDVVVRGRAKRAEWRYDPSSQEVTANDPYAGAIAFVAGAPRQRRVAATPPVKTAGERAPAPAKNAGRKAAPAKKAGRKAAPAKKAGRKAAPAKKTGRKAAPAKKTAGRATGGRVAGKAAAPAGRTGSRTAR